MNLKDKIENNVVIWFLGTLIAGFVAGIGTYEAFVRMARLEPVAFKQDEASRKLVHEVVADTSDVDVGLRALFWDSAEEVKRYYGVPEEIHKSGDSLYLNYRRHGISFLLEYDKVIAIFLYRGGVSGYSGYPRNIAKGLRVGMHREDIEVLYGKVDRLGGGIIHDHTYYKSIDGMRVSITYDSMEDHADAIANTIAVSPM
jgi:hypothetical protein